MNKRIISPQPEEDDIVLDQTIRPQRLNELINQDHVRENLSILIEAARQREEALDHVLLYGPPGLGKCITSDSYILTEGGWTEFSALIPSDIAEGEYVPHQTCLYGLEGLEHASHVYSGGVKDTIHLETRSGFAIEGTPNHPIVVATPDGPQWKRLDQVTCDDWVAIARGMQIWGSPQSVQYQITVPGGEQRRTILEREVRFVHQALSERLGRPPCASELRYACRADNSPSSPLAAQRIGLSFSDGRRMLTQQIEIQVPSEIYISNGYSFPTTITPQVAYLVGLIIGDGHFESRQENFGACRIHNCDDELLGAVQALCHNLFNYKASIKRYNGRTPFVPLPQNIGRFFLHIGLQAVTAEHKKIPAAILHSPAPVVAMCLRGLFDSDGNVWPEGYVEFSSSSCKLVIQVQLLLANFGIIAHRSQKDADGKPHYSLFIGGQDAELFHEHIGFGLSCKRQRASGNGKHPLPRGTSRSEIVPQVHQALRAIIKKTAPHSRALYKRLDHVRSGDRNFSRRIIQEYLELLGPKVHTLPEMQVVDALRDPKIYWDRVAVIRPGQARVYDFCVPGTHSFVANGFYNHNTTLAHITANEMEVPIRVTSGPAIERAGDLAAILSNLREKEVLFIDEVHRLGRAVEEILYPAMEDFALDFVIGKGPSARSIRLNLPRFTVVGATTRLALLTAPLRTRFGAIFRVDFYDQEALEAIVRRTAWVLDVEVDDAGTAEIAQRGRGTPRVVNRLLRRVRDFAQVRADGRITAQVARDALDLLEVDERGLDDLDRQVLHTIIEKFSGGPVGLETIAAAVSEEPDTIMDVIEPYLLRLGFLDRTPRGRVATMRAYEHLDLPYDRAEQPRLL
jgi:Holliday junction DNA helicase RuvB subunit